MRLFAERGVTRVGISELAAASGMARGTIYSHVPDIDMLFEEVAAGLAHEMTERIVAGFAGIDDPARRMAIGMRLYIRRAHEEPVWGRFISRFGFSDVLLREVLTSAPTADFLAGIESGRYSIGRDLVQAMVGLLVGGTLAAMLPVLEGHRTWRDIGSEAAELMLRTVGLSPQEARTLARCELPALAEVNRG
ncbi:MAG TPA: helix-turn-helix domain-containing protein [Burkholderiaceae bacterium]|nr:helix-turn-helix domain-containing protein [Burkholderiaceae bacterium]